MSATTQISGLSENIECSERSRRDLVESLETLAEELDARQRKLDIAKVSLSSTGLAGGIMTVVGLALVPVTFGASLGLTIAGGVIGGGSAIGNISSLIADKVISKKTLEKAQNQLDDFAKKSELLQTKLKTLISTLTEQERLFARWEIQKCPMLSDDVKRSLICMLKDTKNVPLPVQVKVIEKQKVKEAVQNIILAAKLLMKAGKAGRALKGIATGAEAVAGATNVGKSIGTAADMGTDAASTTGRVAASGVKVAGMAMAGVGIALDLGAMIYYSYKIHKNKPSDLAVKIRSAAECLK